MPYTFYSILVFCRRYSTSLHYIRLENFPLKYCFDQKVIQLTLQKNKDYLKTLKLFLNQNDNQIRVPQNHHQVIAMTSIKKKLQTKSKAGIKIKNINRMKYFALLLSQLCTKYINQRMLHQIKLSFKVTYINFNINFHNLLVLISYPNPISIFSKY